MKNKSNIVGNLFKIAAAALVASAIYQEMKKPPEERQWHGKVFDFVPYDFRLPTAQRVRERFWNPDDPRIFTEHAFGVGWAVNLHSVLQKLRASRGEPEATAPEDREQGSQ